MQGEMGHVAEHTSWLPLWWVATSGVRPFQAGACSYARALGQCGSVCESMVWLLVSRLGVCKCAIAQMLQLSILLCGCDVGRQSEAAYRCCSCKATYVA